jgi:hypothetical protein
MNNPEKIKQGYYVEIFRANSEKSLVSFIENIELDLLQDYSGYESLNSYASLLAAKAAVRSYLEDGYGTTFKVAASLISQNDKWLDSSHNESYSWNIEVNIEFVNPKIGQ